jgi:peptidoglycan hydrolase-like protein with peptidoglycan-binding domain
MAMRAPTLWVAFFTLIVLWPEMVAAQEATAPIAATAAGPITAAQQQLNRAGYAAGPANGVMTEPTRRAITAYERRAGRPPEALAGLGGDPVERVQAGLRQLGFFAGRLDGRLGPETRDAIIRFEASRQLPIDPRVSDRLLAELDRAAPAGTPAQPAIVSSGAPSPETAQPELGRRRLPAWENPPPIR